MNSNFIPDLLQNSQDEPDDDFNVIGGEIFATFSPWASWLNNGNPFAPLAMPALVGTAVTGSSLTDPASVVAVTSGGLTINLLFDAAAMAAPASFRAGIQQAAAILSSAISDQITVNIKIDYSGKGGGASAGPDHGVFVSYSTIRDDLVNNASAGDTTFNALTAGSSIQGQSSVAVWNAQQKLWGLLGANDTTTDDGSATFATDINPNLLVGVALHELTHALGRVPYGSQPDIFDFYRFTAPGTRLFQGTATAPAAYFSTDGGVTKLADYGRTSDSSDFLNTGVQGSTDPFDEFYNGSTSQKLTALDLTQLDALGFHLSGGSAPNHAPVLTVASPDVSATAGQVLQASSLFSATDADNDAVGYYLVDYTPAANSGHFVVNGAAVAAQTVTFVSAAQLAQTSFVAGSKGSSDDLYVQAFDGHTVSSWSEFHVTVNHAPVLTVASPNVTATAGQVLQASSLFSATDADNDAVGYYLVDYTPAANSGHFVVNGTAVAAQTVTFVNAAQLAQTSFVAGSNGSSDDLYVQAFDGHTVSSWSEFHVTVNHAPVLTVASPDVSATAGRSLQASSLFSATDADNDAVGYYVVDYTPDVNSGHFVVNGTAVAAQTVTFVSAAQLAQTSFVAGSNGSSDDLYVQAFDGHTVSNWSEFHVDVNHGPALAVASPDTIATAGQVLQASSLFSATDPDNDAVGYYLVDYTPDANSGHFVVNGTAVAAQTVTFVSAAQLAQTSFVAGSNGSSDDLYVQAFDGHTVSSWSEFHVDVPNPVPAARADSGFTFAASLGSNVAMETISQLEAAVLHLHGDIAAPGPAGAPETTNPAIHVDLFVQPHELQPAGHSPDYFIV